jgi:hypothetical protein
MPAKSRRGTVFQGCLFSVALNRMGLLTPEVSAHGSPGGKSLLLETAMKDPS